MWCVVSHHMFIHTASVRVTSVFAQFNVSNDQHFGLFWCSPEHIIKLKDQPILSKCIVFFSCPSLCWRQSLIKVLFTKWLVKKHSSGASRDDQRKVRLQSTGCVIENYLEIKKRNTWFIMRPENKEYWLLAKLKEEEPQSPSNMRQLKGFVKNKKQTKLERPQDEVWKTNGEKEDWFSPIQKHKSQLMMQQKPYIKKQERNTWKPGAQGKLTWIKQELFRWQYQYCVEQLLKGRGRINTNTKPVSQSNWGQTSSYRART